MGAHQLCDACSGIKRESYGDENYYLRKHGLDLCPSCKGLIIEGVHICQSAPAKRHPSQLTPNREDRKTLTPNREDRKTLTPNREDRKTLTPNREDRKTYLKKLAEFEHEQEMERQAAEYELRCARVNPYGRH